jgi:hypothetical protein
MQRKKNKNKMQIIIFAGNIILFDLLIIRYLKAKINRKIFLNFKLKKLICMYNIGIVSFFFMFILKLINKNSSISLYETE